MAKGLLDEMLDRVESKVGPAKQRMIEEVHEQSRQFIWIPNPGPQTDAYLSEADIALFGGAAGGGKSQLLLGWSINEAQIGIIFRRELSQTDGLERDGKSIIGSLAGFNGTDLEWTWSDGKSLKLGGMKDADSWIAHAGRERGFIGFDEAGEFLELQVASMFAWLRAPEGSRTRMILASNPPRTSDGLWFMEWFGPWIDETHKLYPTEPGQLRWAVYLGSQEGGTMVWVDGPGEYEVKGETYTARSYTFIPASLEDNPYRNTPEYRAQLQNLPEPLRSQLLKGDFSAGLQDAANQVIPTAWVRAAQARWKDKPPADVPMCAIGVDPCGGGDDQMVQAPRFDSWFAPLIKTAGKDIPIDRQGTFAAGLVLAQRRDGAMIVIDMGGGYGGALYNHLTENNIECIAYKGAAASTKRTVDSKLAFTNTRSAAYWGFREALDPDQPGGSPVALPLDTRLLAELCAPTYEVTSRGIKVEPKSKREGGEKGVVERLGFSPDEADAVVMSWWAGPRMATHGGDWIDRKLTNKGRGLRGMQPKVILGRQTARRKR
jgi:hypothetical protein